MSNFNTEEVVSVHHWNETLFTFRTTRDPSLRFHNGHFVMVGIEVDGKPLMRAYSVASAHYEEHLEFFSIKVPDGPLTSRLQHLKVGDDDPGRPQADRHAGARPTCCRAATSTCSPPAPAWRRS